MPLTGVVLIIVAVAFCILVLTLIPTLLTIKRSAAAVGELAEMVQGELKPALQELTGALSELRSVGDDLSEHSGDIKCFMSALAETSVNLRAINRSVGVVASVVNTTSVWAAGTKVAAKYVLDQYLKKRGDSNHVRQI